jgi:transcriptional regulator with XRE-family HTH domain
MTPDQIKQCRTRMRLSQANFGKRIGVSRSTAIQYEAGRRLDTKKPVEIGQTTDLACGAAWLGVEGYTAILNAAARADAQVGDSTPILPGNAVEPWIAEAAVQELEARGFSIGEHHLAFPLLVTLAVWSQITHWCPGRGISTPMLHPVISASVPAVAILEFATQKSAFDFKLYCTGGR